MRTALVAHGWLDNPSLEYRGKDKATGVCRRVRRWLAHYRGCWPAVFIDNGSAPNSCGMASAIYQIRAINLHPHYARASMLDYPNVWRAYWIIKNDLLTRYDRVLYIQTDAYVLSQRLLDYLDGCTTGWTALWSPRYNFPEACIQVITRCPEFEEFFAGDMDAFKYNGRVEEITLPFTHVEKGFVGDRYGEYEPSKVYEPGMEYYCQVPDSLDWDDSQFPVVRRVNGKLVVTKL